MREARANPQMPSHCPSCDCPLEVTRLACRHCDTEVRGSYALPVLARLDAEDQELLLHFVRSSGSLKGLARRYGISYPKVRNRLDGLIGRLDRRQAAAEGGEA